MKFNKFVENILAESSKNLYTEGMKNENNEILIKAINHMVKEIESFAKNKQELSFITKSYLYQVAGVGKEAVEKFNILNQEQDLGTTLNTY